MEYGLAGTSVTATASDIYRLQVTDENNCEGRDSIIVNKKQCQTGLYIQNAFTPNSDGRTDTFKRVAF
jgi:hypothetical protein